MSADVTPLRVVAPPKAEDVDRANVIRVLEDALALAREGRFRYCICLFDGLDGSFTRMETNFTSAGLVAGLGATLHRAHHNMNAESRPVIGPDGDGS